MTTKHIPAISAGSPAVSVVIPAYNHERYIRAAVDSVLKQTLSDLELIVIDDGSTDKTGKIIKTYDDPRLHYYYQENQDAYNALNKGLSLTQGKFVAILNSDDLFALNRLERLVNFSQEKNAACIFTDVVPISDEGTEFTDPSFIWNIWHQKNRDWYFTCKDLYRGFLKGNFMVSTSNLFMTKEAMRTVGNFSALRYLHDYDYIFRMMLTYPNSVHYLDQEKLLYYRIHSANTLSEAAITGRVQDQELISKYMAARLPENYRADALTGAERLIELGNELHDVKEALEPQKPQGIRPAWSELLSSLKSWVSRKCWPFNKLRS